jgi:hypothetical protein
MMDPMMKFLLTVLTCLSVLALDSTANAESVTGTGFDKSATIEDLKSNAPQGSKIIDTSCVVVGMPSGGTNKYRCTVTWE